MTTKPDWVLTKTFNLFLERWKPKPSHKHVSKFRCELQSVLFDLQLDRKVTFFDSNPEFLSNDEFMYELKKRLIDKHSEQERLEERFGLKLF